MANPSLVAKPDTIIINTDAGQMVDHTQVEYDGNGDDVDVWVRFINKSWTKLNLVTLAKPSTPKEAEEALVRGKIQSPNLAPGEVLQYGIMLAHSGLDPNMPGFNEDRFADLLTIFALMKRSGDPNWITEQGMHTGGTFRLRDVATGALPTFFLMQIGQSKPVLDNLGMFRFASPERTRLSAFATLHKVEATPLLPGTHYFATIRLSDSAGRWTSLVEEFTTLRRRIEVRFHHIRIHDDGDNDTFFIPHDDGDNVTFGLRVFEGTTLVQEFTWGKGDVSDEFGKNVVLFDPPHTHVLGPKSVTLAELDVGVNIKGTEEDDLGDEHAENDGFGLPRIHRFNVPVGFGQEQVLLQSEDVVAHPRGVDSSLHFTVKVSHAIDYVA